MKMPPLTQEIFKKYAQLKKLSKKHCLLHQGEVSQKVYFVKYGCLRMWYNDCGNDITLKFFIAGEVVASLESFYHQLPSKFGIESVVATEVMSIDKAIVKEYLANSSALKDEMLTVSISCMTDYQNLFLNRIMKNPEDRFHSLMEQSPDLFEIIPHHYIASYLGITPVSLSRIRNRAAKR